MSEHKGESSAQVWDSRMWQGLMKWVADEQYVERRRIVAGEAQKNIQALLAEDKLDELTLDDFNEYVWKFGEIMGPDGAIGSQEAEQSYSPEELRESFQSGELRVTGQHTVGGGVRIYYPAFKGSDQEKTQLLRRTLHELLYSSDDLYANLDAVKAEANGFGENWATMILCMMHTDEMGIMNGKSKEAVRKLAGMLGVGEGWEEPVDDYHAFNELVAQMRDASGGALQDLLAVDAFLNRVADLGEPQYWKVALSPQASFHEELVDMCVEEGCAAIGFLEKPDDHSVKRFREIRPGDYVVMHTKASIGGVGRVTRPYYETGGDYVVGEISHFQRRIDVDWLIGTYPYGDAFPGAKQRDTVATLDDTVFWRLASNYADDPRFREVLGEAPDFRYWVFQGNPKLWDFEEMLSRATPFQENWTTSKYREEMSEGDTVYIWQSGEQAGIYAVARIVSEPYEVTNDPYGDWKTDLVVEEVFDEPLLRPKLKADPRTSEMEIIRQAQGSNFRLTPAEDAAIRAMLGQTPDGTAIEAVADACCAPVEFIEEILAQLEKKKQMVFYGPPGTGKTFVARELAQFLAEGDEQRWDLIQFHPSYTYEDFMEGIKPQSVPVGEDSYEVSYPVLAGSFMRFCERASEDSDRIYTFIIDEINRGQIAKIFGELMYLLEYREDNIQLAYTKSEGDETLAQFAIPDNVRIIGTMNTADRSIALVDFALRRRFAFYPFYPDDDSHVQGMLEHWLQKRSPEALWIADFAERLNELLGRDVGRDFLVGHSYFMDAEGMGEEQLREVWRFQIEPLLHEYFVGKDNKLGAYDLDQLIAEAKGVTPEADGEDEAGEPLGDSEAEEEEPAGAEDQ
jgi:MoxR-like ATPase